MAGGLPPGFVARPPTTEDATEVAALIGACRAVDTNVGGMEVAELLDDWAGIELATEAVVVATPDGRLAGYADVLNWVHAVVSVYGYVHPGWRGRGLGRFLVGWGEAWTRTGMARAPAGARIVVQHFVVVTNEGAQRLLAAAGYEPVRRVYEMETELDGAPPAPEWPAGIAVRRFVPGRDERSTFEAVEDAFRDVWGRPPGTFERFRGMIEREGFDPGLWLLAVDGEEIAGAALGKAVAGEGWVDVVGVRRPWRGRGLALALLRALFAAYRARGVERVGLSVDAESATGAPRHYDRAGMRVVRSYVLYRKELRPGADPSAAVGLA